ncbi:MAG: aminotransferase class V-fold PLP-dependent enzyme [Alphaproteobacteria bacterium]|nr:aminotransferase class V-fold PLP-dependent enzyme [Alphaproteobacteria bacterium]
MSLKRGRKFLNTPGPTNVPERVLQAMHRQVMDLSDPEFLEVSKSCFLDMRKVIQTKGEIFLYASNGHGAWEAALSNVFEPGDKVLVPESGNFSNSWSTMARAMHLEVKTIPGDWRRALRPEAVEARLKEDTKGEIKGILLVHTDTATGITCDVPAVRAAIDAAGHPALLLVDTVAALGTCEYRMDDWGIDVTVSASQKGMMMPPGLGIVAASQKALDVTLKTKMPRHYWDWKTRMEAAHYRKFCGTAPQLMVFGMRESLNMLFEEGLETVFERHRVLAGATHAAVEVWGQAGALYLNASEPRERSVGVTTIRTGDGIDANDIRVVCRDEMMAGLGGGLGDFDGKAFRIAHMGDTNAPMLYGALGAVESTLGYLNIPYASGGVTAAVDHITQAKKTGAGPFTY